MIKINGVSSNRQYIGSLPVFNYKKGYDYSIPFYVENITNDIETVYFFITQQMNRFDIEVSMDGNNWTVLSYTTDEYSYISTISLQPGDKVYVRASTTSWAVRDEYWGIGHIWGMSKVGGNIMSLLYGSSFINQTDFPIDSTDNFRRFFYEDGNNTLSDVGELLLPANTLTSSCYYEMFLGTGRLTTAPKLPALNLASHCYKSMFVSSGITSIVLPATTLAPYCYNEMFFAAGSISNITCLATDISATGCTEHWLLNVPGSGTFTKNANMSSWTTGVDGIPEGWTVQDA